MLALGNLLAGLQSVHPNDAVIDRELEDNWEVLGEPIQTAMRAAELAGRPGMEHPYEQVKTLMRGQSISQGDVEAFIDSLDFDEVTRARLKSLTPAGYTGLAGKLVGLDNPERA